MKKNQNEGVMFVISEVALFFFFYYAQMIVNAKGNLWLQSLVLTILINLAIVLCPPCRKHFKK